MPSMREALESAITEHEEPADDTQTTTEVQTADVETSSAVAEDTSTDVIQDETKTESAPAEVKADDTAGKPVETQPEKPVETPEQRAAHRVDRAPASWKKDAKGAWAELPLQVRQEVYKREMEVERVLKETAPIRQEMETIRNTVAPYMARIQSLGATPVQAIDSLLKADHLLATAPRAQRAQFLAKLISDYDVDVTDLDAAIVAMMKGQQQPQQQSPQGFDPAQITQLVQQQLSQALAPFRQEHQQREQAVVQQAAHTVESMSLDPKYPYFEDVRMDMADLIEINARRGVVLSMEDAYDRAVRSNPETFGQITQQSSLTQANQQHLQAQRAKTAASSVSGAPAGGGSSVHVGDGSLRSQIEAAFNNSRI